jgi:hypothetical protein
MKFLYSDTQDYVDPHYDFINDRHAPGRKRYWDDAYAHEIMTPAPYDGLLVAMSAVRQAPGVAASKVRYTTAEEQRMLRTGVRKFLRYDGEAFKNNMVMGDCGAFAYVDLEKPAFDPDEVAEFYTDAEFTHGVSPDHIIFECDVNNPPASVMGDKVAFRYGVTRENAENFLKLVASESFPFEPIGAVQGWSPQSIASLAVDLEKMGYGYLAIGGLVPLKVDAIHQVLSAVRSAIKPETKIHLLGFAKADNIHEFTGYNITSFDSTSPLIRAFKDARSNYYFPAVGGGLNYYAAVRIPQAIENTRLVQGIKRGIFSTDDLLKSEKDALAVLREYDKGSVSIDSVLDTVMEYQKFLTLGDSETDEKREREWAKIRTLITKTLVDKPWQKCGCDICTRVGVEVIIFRSSNRNKRRGFHNLGVYHKHVQKIIEQAK